MSKKSTKKVKLPKNWGKMKGESTKKKEVVVSGDSMCGGVIKQSTFDKEPMGHMMCFMIPDEHWEEYINEKDKKKQHLLFKKWAWSAI